MHQQKNKVKDQNRSTSSQSRVAQSPNEKTRSRDFNKTLTKKQNLISSDLSDDVFNDNQIKQQGSEMISKKPQTNQRSNQIQNQITPPLTQNSINLSESLSQTHGDATNSTKKLAGSKRKNMGENKQINNKKICMSLDQALNPETSLSIDQASSKKIVSSEKDCKTGVNSRFTNDDQILQDNSTLMQQIAQSQQTGSTRHGTRDKSKNVNYSLFFQDFDYLSQEEENKRKREQKKQIKRKPSNQVDQPKQIQILTEEPKIQVESPQLPVAVVNDNQIQKPQEEDVPVHKPQKARRSKQAKAIQEVIQAQKDQMCTILQNPVVQNMIQIKDSVLEQSKPKKKQSKSIVKNTSEVQNAGKQVEDKTLDNSQVLQDHELIKLPKSKQTKESNGQPKKRVMKQKSKQDKSLDQKDKQDSLEASTTLANELSAEKIVNLKNDEGLSTNSPILVIDKLMQEQNQTDQIKTDETQINTLLKQDSKEEEKVEELPERKEYCISGPTIVKGHLIKNPFDKNIRSQAIDFIDFNNSSTENNQYKPAMIQKEQDQVQKKVQSHFIHKKQSQCNIKRISGVSYIKKSESKQLDVRENYEKLAPLVIQGSYHLPSKLQDQEKFLEIQEQVEKMLFSENSYLVCASFESGNETAMKKYLLKPHKRLEIAKGQLWVIKNGGLKQAWKFIKDKYFLVIHLIYDHQHLVRNISQEDINDQGKIACFIQESDICLGILTKRGNASIKSMIKVYNLEDQYMDSLKYQAQQSQYKSSLESKDGQVIDKIFSQNEPQIKQNNFDVAQAINCQGALINGINTIALMLRFELYVPENKWKSISKEDRGLINTFMSCCEESLHPILLDWNKQRTQIIQGKQSQIQELLFRINIKDYLQQVKEIEQSTTWQQIDKDLQKYNEINDLMLNEEVYKKDQNPNDILNQLRNSLPIPVTLINTRDCFVYDLHIKETKVNLGKGRENAIKKEYFFPLDQVPQNYKEVVGISKDEEIQDVEKLRVGITTFENFYTNEEMKNMEHMIEQTEKKSLQNAYLPMTAQKTFSGNTLKRTKFFFGFRYMWTRTQLLEPLSNVAAGVRADVSQPPVWMKTILEEPLVNAGIIEKDFINSVALNVYHDGSEGLAQHFDDATRFKQPIYTLRLFSDSRLSFGSQYYGFCNGAFTIPLPRGCICVMEEGSYSANGVKHCIRPCDMTGKSSAVILRQMHPNVVNEAIRYDRHVDLPMWMSSLKLEDDAVPFYQQKELECQEIEFLQQQAANPDGQHTSNHFNGILEPKKRGPKLTVHSLEKKIIKQKQKDEKEVSRVLDDMIHRVEFKIQEEMEVLQRYMIYNDKNFISQDIAPILAENMTQSNSPNHQSLDQIQSLQNEVVRQNESGNICQDQSIIHQKLPSINSQAFSQQAEIFSQGLASCIIEDPDNSKSNQNSSNFDRMCLSQSFTKNPSIVRSMIAPFIVKKYKR